MKPQHVLASVAFLAALLVAGCGGGGGNDSAPPAAQWSTAQVAPLPAGGIVGVFADGTGGVFVVSGANSDGLVVQRFGTTTGWTGQAVQMSGLKSLQAVGIDQGVALFGRDQDFWYREDHTTAGPQPRQTLFPTGKFRFEVKFSRAYDGTIVATHSVSMVSGTVSVNDIAYVATREFRQGTWTAPELVPVLWMSSIGPIPIPDYQLQSTSLVRTKYGDVATISLLDISPGLSFVALRRPGETAFTQATEWFCYATRCGRTYGYYEKPVLELDGSATVVRNSGSVGDWISIRAIPPTSLWPATVAAGSPNSIPTARLVRSDGTPVWLANVGETLTLWEGTRQVPWTTPDSTPCASFVTCTNAFSTPDTSHVATLQFALPILYVSDRADDGGWSGVASVDLTSLQASTGAGSKLSIVGYHASNARQIVIGVAVPPRNDLFPALTPPSSLFAVARL